MKLLLLGDIVGEDACAFLCRHLWQWRKKEEISCVIANGENVCCGNGNGLDAQSAKNLLQGGVDVLTGGNHTFAKSSLYPLLEDCDTLLRPANYPSSVPGKGDVIVDADGVRILVCNLLGRMYLDPVAEDPFACLDRLLTRHTGEYDLSVVDFHAEATAEKLALAHAFAGRVSVLFGTHTHVPTADVTFLQKEGKCTAYQTDLGMCGPSDSILGVEASCIVRKFRTGLPTKFQLGKGPCRFCGAVVTVSSAMTVTAYTPFSLTEQELFTHL